MHCRPHTLPQSSTLYSLFTYYYTVLRPTCQVESSLFFPSPSKASLKSFTSNPTYIVYHYDMRMSRQKCNFLMIICTPDRVMQVPYHLVWYTSCSSSASTIPNPRGVRGTDLAFLKGPLRFSEVFWENWGGFGAEEPESVGLSHPESPLYNRVSEEPPHCTNIVQP
jgi:hypothetical protein